MQYGVPPLLPSVSLCLTRRTDPSQANIYVNIKLTNCHALSGFLEDNPDGTLSRKKMMEMYRDVLSQEKANVFVDQIFGRYDTDNSGEIDFKVGNL